MKSSSNSRTMTPNLNNDKAPFGALRYWACGAKKDARIGARTPAQAGQVKDGDFPSNLPYPRPLTRILSAAEGRCNSGSHRAVKC